ncbi:MAG: sugar isomerase, partial [Pyrinomonas methylaliphatogenes]|nr:sugar isomerase [Pyrinomonas methylaliphatogenes]
MGFEIDDEFIAKQNRKLEAELETDYAHLGEVLRRRGIDIEEVTKRAQAFRVALPSWGVGTGGTRFA